MEEQRQRDQLHIIYVMEENYMKFE